MDTILHSTSILHSWAKRCIIRITPTSINSNTIYTQCGCIIYDKISAIRIFLLLNIMIYKNSTPDRSLCSTETLFQATQSQPNNCDRRRDQSSKEASWYANATNKATLWVLSPPCQQKPARPRNRATVALAFIACFQGWMLVTG